MKFRSFVLLCAALAAQAAAAAGLFEREVVFSEAQIQAALERGKPQRLSYGGLLAVTLSEPPRVLLDGDDGRARILAALDVEVPGNPPLRVDVAGRAGIRYDERGKAFFLDKPVADSVRAPALRAEAVPATRQAITQLMEAYFREKPVHVLREDGSPQEIAARWLLKSVRIEPGRVVAVLSTL
jgi:hypothetical protein